MFTSEGLLLLPFVAGCYISLKASASLNPFIEDWKWICESTQGNSTFRQITLTCLFSILDCLGPILVILCTLHSGKEVQVHCDTLVCIISFLAYTLIIKYLRGRVEESRAKRVPLRLKLTITQLLKVLSSFALETQQDFLLYWVYSSGKISIRLS